MSSSFESWAEDYNLEDDLLVWTNKKTDCHNAWLAGYRSGSEEGMTTNLWKTVESEAWSNGLSYEDYLALHQERQKEEGLRTYPAPLSRGAYVVICHAFDVELEADEVDTHPMEVVLS